ncbi:uncharacterized protein si:dkey-261h17.1 isoform X2 [Chelmon rostratus]|uniref:uncharacterized protein si:dkey-261h17.1 isoform X2 n=1 Tax=Chelmon rostratus TaxID=109905 RepID=UPI001BE6E8A8|nr:uncharacterized protein si:dkey-261h17.1 isoform X2 [Chelmon rostratus]
MAASMWRMNGLWRRMAGVLVLCTLLLSSEVMCQDDAATDATDAPAADPADAADAAAPPDATTTPDVGAAPTVSVGAELAPTAAPGDNSFLATILTLHHDILDLGASDTGTTASPNAGGEVAAPPEVPDDAHILKSVPDVTCVGEDEIPENNAVRVEMATDDCEATKHIIEETPVGLCEAKDCDLKIFQNGKTALMASDNVKLSTLAKALQSESFKEKLGVTKIETPPSSSGSSVFVGLLVSGLLAALAITIGYFKCQRRTDTKGVRLAEEAYPVDQENQGNTLVSVAPLNPPPETPEKPSVNGESPEAAKTQPPPPTNGHSTTKTADTEL